MYLEVLGGLDGVVARAVGEEVVEDMRRADAVVHPVVEAEALRVGPVDGREVEDILNGNNRQLRGGKGNAAHQESIEIYTQLHAKSKGLRTDRPSRIITHWTKSYCIPPLSLRA